MGSKSVKGDVGCSASNNGGFLTNLKSLLGSAFSVGESLTATTIAGYITKENVKSFLEHIEKKDEFFSFVRILLPKIYIRICIRYITPIVVFVLMLGASTYGLYYNGILYQYEQYVMDIFDSIAESTVNNLICLIRRIRRMLRLGRALKGNGKGTMLPLSYHLRSAYTEQPKETFNTVDILNDPVKALFGAM